MIYLNMITNSRFFDLLGIGIQSILVGCLVSLSQGLECYSCIYGEVIDPGTGGNDQVNESGGEPGRQQLDQRCLDPSKYTDMTTLICEPGYEYCLKQTTMQHTPQDGGGIRKVKIVLRGCGILQNSKGKINSKFCLTSKGRELGGWTSSMKDDKVETAALALDSRSSSSLSKNEARSTILSKIGCLCNTGKKCNSEPGLDSTGPEYSAAPCTLLLEPYAARNLLFPTLTIILRCLVLKM